MYMAAIAMGDPLCPVTKRPASPMSLPMTRLPLAARGKYLVTVIGCGDCHTPKIMTERGPVPDMEKFLSGYQAGTELGKFDTAMTKDGRWALLKGDHRCGGPLGYHLCRQPLPSTIPDWVDGHWRISAGPSKEESIVAWRTPVR